MVGPRLPLGEDLVVGHVHARGAADTEGSSLSPRIKRRIRAKTSLAEIERKERGRTNIPGPPRLRTLVADAAEVPISEGSLVPASTPTSGPQRAHPYTPVGDAVGSSSFEMVPPVRARAASDRGFDDSADTIPIARANSSPSIIQVPTHFQHMVLAEVPRCTCVGEPPPPKNEPQQLIVPAHEPGGVNDMHSVSGQSTSIVQENHIHTLCVLFRQESSQQRCDGLRNTAQKADDQHPLPFLHFVV